MPAPVLVSSDPTDASTGASVDQIVTLTFDVAILATSAGPSTIQVFRSDDTVPLRGSISVQTTKVIFVPEKSLHDDTLYRIRAIGSDKALGFFLRSSTGEALATTLELSFRTGEERYVSLEEIASRDDIERVGPIRETDPLALQPAGGSLTIDSRTPEPYETQVSIAATGLTIDFSETIDPLTVNDATVVVTQTPVLGIEDYYAAVPTGASSDGNPRLALQGVDGAVVLTPPTGTLVADADKVHWVLDSADDFLYNTQVRVKLTTSIAGSDAGATLLETTEYFFTTEYFPLFIGSDYLRIELGPAVVSLTDDTLNRIIHKNSIDAWELSNRDFALTDPTWRVRKWVGCKSILDVLGVLMLTKDLTAGGSKTLGDLTIASRPANPQLGAKYDQATKCLEDIQLFSGTDMLAMATIKGADAATERKDFRMRGWTHLQLQAEPSANMGAERGEKSRLGVEYAAGGKDQRFVQRFALTAVRPF
jgi:hypothetical protein